MNTNIFFYIIGAILFCVLTVIFSKPIGTFMKIIVNSALGGICLIAFNFISQIFGFFIGINVLTALTVGILGIPGFIMLLMLKLIVS